MSKTLRKKHMLVKRFLKILSNIRFEAGLQMGFVFETYIIIYRYLKASYDRPEYETICKASFIGISTVYSFKREM